MSTKTIDVKIEEFNGMQRHQKVMILGMAHSEKERRSLNTEILCCLQERERRFVHVEGIIGSIAVLKNIHEDFKNNPYTAAYITLDDRTWRSTNCFWETPEQAYLDCLGRQHEGANSKYGQYA